ncbi:MAG TPA: hypothetical protein VH353_05915 [Caulobacteraceae bacterium]|nr:hypothetical protein [Caulobacteraceae bacterium]
MLFTAGAHAEAAANGAKDAHAKRHHRRVERHAAPMVQDNSAAMESEMAAMREQLDQLKAAQQQQSAQDQAQMDQMRSQLAQAQASAQAAQEQLNSQIQTIPGAVDKAVAAVAPKTDKIYYRGITITPGGFAAIESVYRSHNQGADIGSSFSGIPLPSASSGAGRTAEYRETARQSRFSLLAEGNVTPDVHLTAYGEADFLGAALTANSNESNSYNLRMRVLYTQIDWKQEWGKLEFLGGQNWSLATLYTKGLAPRSENVPLTIDAQYAVGFNWARQPQMRLAADFNDHVWLAVSVENPQTTFYTSGKYNPGVSLVDTIPGGAEFPGSGTTYALSLNKIPDIIAKVAVDENLQGHSLHAEAYGLYRNFYARLDTSGAFSNESVPGGGVGGGAIFGLVPSLVDIQASGLVGRGIGRYGSGQLTDVSFGLDGTIKPIQEWELMLGGVVHPVKTLDVYAYAGEEREMQQQYGTSTSLQNGIGNTFLNNAGCEVDGGTCGNSTHYIEQITAGFWQRPYVGKFGRVQWGIQYSYTERHLFPGYGAVNPSLVTFNPAPIARENMIFTSIRYYPF